jgi:hypothetical protein
MIDITLSNGPCSRRDGRLHTGRVGRCSATGSAPTPQAALAEQCARLRQALQKNYRYRPATRTQPAGPGTRVDQEGGTVAYQDRIHGSGPACDHRKSA